MTSHTTESFKTASTTAMSKACLHCLSSEFAEMERFLAEMQNYQEYQNPVTLLDEKQHLPPAFLALAYHHFGAPMKMLIPLQKALEEQPTASLKQKLEDIAKNLMSPEQRTKISKDLMDAAPVPQGNPREHLKKLERHSEINNAFSSLKMQYDLNYKEAALSFDFNF